MPNDRERIMALENRMVELDAAIHIASVLPINILSAILDKFVGERRIEAALREEIWQAVREEINTAEIGSKLVADAARAAVPRRRRPAATTAPITRGSPTGARETLRTRSVEDGADG